MPEILPVCDKETYDAVTRASMEDGHYALAPSHYWRDSRGEIAGYFSNGAVQACHFWSKRTNPPKLSVKALKACHQIAIDSNAQIRQMGLGMICCAESSPFFPVMERLGYKPLVKTVLFIGYV